jgi:hypothetical protein
MATASAADSAVLEPVVCRLPPGFGAAPSMATPPTQFQTGNIVFIREDNSTPLHSSGQLWVILDTHPGSDGNIPVVTIKISKGLHNNQTQKFVSHRVNSEQCSNLLGGGSMFTLGTKFLQFTVLKYWV